MPAAPVWVPTFPPARPRVPARDSYHVPRGGWSGSGAHSARSPAHPTGPARPWPRGSRGCSGRGFGTEGPQLSSGQLRGGRARRDALRLGLVKEVWANAHAGPAVLRDLRFCGTLPAASSPPGSATDVRRVCEVRASRSGPASPLPRKRGRGGAFHNKSPAWGSRRRRRRLEQEPRC